MALCSLSTGRIATPRAARGLRHERARHDEHFLVGEGDRLAGVDRGEHGLEAGGAGRRADDDVGVGMGRDGDQTIGATGQRCRRRRRRTLRSAGRAASMWPTPQCAADSARPARRAARRCRPRRAPRQQSRVGCASTTASALWPIEPVEPRIARRLHEMLRTIQIERPGSRTAARRCDRARRRARE